MIERGKLRFGGSVDDALEEAGRGVRHLVNERAGLAVGTVSMPHPVSGPSSAYHLFAFVGAHEARHATQIRQIAVVLTTYQPLCWLWQIGRQVRIVPWQS
jgi:hypothetical protein